MSKSRRSLALGGLGIGFDISIVFFCSDDLCVFVLVYAGFVGFLFLQIVCGGLSPGLTAVMCFVRFSIYGLRNVIHVWFVGIQTVQMEGFFFAAVVHHGRKCNRTGLAAVLFLVGN